MRCLSGWRKRRALAAAVLVAVGLASCDSQESADGAGAPPQTATAPPTTSATVAPAETPVDDPATEEIEVAGEMLTWQVREGPTVGDVTREFWEDEWSMSDPRLTGPSETTMTFQVMPDGTLRWWNTTLMRPEEGTWEGVGFGVLQTNGDHFGTNVYLGTGEYAGLEFHQHMYMGPVSGDVEELPFDVTGWIHPVAVDGWSYDPEFPRDGLVGAVRALTKAWNDHDGRAAALLYAEDAVFLGTDGVETVGRDQIASLIDEAATAVDFQLDLLRTPMVVSGNYVAAPLHWSNKSEEGMVIAIYRFDAHDLIVHHEVLGPSD